MEALIDAFATSQEIQGEYQCYFETITVFPS